MADNTLRKDLVADTSICNMLLRVAPDRADAIVYSIVDDSSLFYRSFPLSDPAKTPLQMLEEAVYENPLLLADFRRVYCVIATPRTLMVPSVASPEECRALFRVQYPDFEGEIRLSATGTANATAVFGIESGLDAFVRRTFAPSTSIESSLALLVRYFATRPGHGATTRMTVNFRETSMDIIALRGQSLQMARTVEFATPADAAYHILDSFRSLGMDPTADELRLTGDRTLREELSPMLRKYVARVMPVIFPPEMFKAGKESLLAPFDLIISPLCE